MTTATYSPDHHGPVPHGRPRKSARTLLTMAAVLFFGILFVFTCMVGGLIYFMDFGHRVARDAVQLSFALMLFASAVRTVMSAIDWIEARRARRVRIG